MRSTIKSLIATIFISGFFCQYPAYSASQKVDTIGRISDIDRALSSSGIEMTRSTKERMLSNFKKERQELYENRAKEPHLFKNRLNILSSKIDHLEKDLARGKLAKPVIAKLVVKENPKPKGYAPMAERRRYFLAMKADIVALKSPMDLEKREGPFEMAMPIKIDAVKPVKTEIIQIDPQQLVLMEKRQAPQEGVVAPSRPEIVKLNNKSLKIGSDWQGMLLSDKEIYILSVMGNLSRRDVYLMKSYTYYIQSIDEAIQQNPDLGEEYVHRILMMTAYESEPDTRKDLEKVWK